MKFEKMAKKIEELGVQALLYEVAATPKPGLVDGANNGAHGDMDIFTFIRSATALGPAFSACFRVGAESDGEATALLPAIRRIGIAAEEDMLRATGGVNTHKGILFSMGILCAAAGIAHGKAPDAGFDPEELCDIAAEIVKGIIERDFKDLDRKQRLTNGERLYLQYGTTGIRGEVAGGFQTVRRVSLPFLRSQWGKTDTNSLLVEALIRLMAFSEDSNILGRHDRTMLGVVQEKAREILGEGGVFAADDFKSVRALDQWCIRKWVSPGGSADMLAVTVFLVMLEQLC